MQWGINAAITQQSADNAMDLLRLLGDTDSSRLKLKANQVVNPIGIIK